MFDYFDLILSVKFLQAIMLISVYFLWPVNYIIFSIIRTHHNLLTHYIVVGHLAGQIKLLSTFLLMFFDGHSTHFCWMYVYINWNFSTVG